MDSDETTSKKRDHIVSAQPKEDEGKTYKKIVVLKLQHYCQGCIRKYRKILWDTTGVEEILPDAAKETVTIKGTMNLETLIENLKVLKRPIEVLPAKGSEIHSILGKKESNKKEQSQYSLKEGKQRERTTEMEEEVLTPGDRDRRKNLTQRIHRIKGVQQADQFSTEATSQYALNKAHKAETISQPALELSEQEPVKIVIVVEDLNEGRKQCQSPISSGNALADINSKTEGRSPTSSDREMAEWFFLIVGLILEGASAFFDQRGNSLVGMVLAFVALFLTTVELFYMARRETLVAMERKRSACFYCCLNDKSKLSELFEVVHLFALTSAVWQCLYSTLQHIYLDNPIKMCLLPFLFLGCVLINKIVRQMEEVNCQDADNIQNQSSLESVDDWKMDQNGPMENKSEVQSNSSEPVDNDGSPKEFGSGDFGMKCNNNSMHQELPKIIQGC